MNIKHIVNFPAACAQAAARAALQVQGGKLPAITLPANDPHRGQYINSITISGDGSVEVVTYAPGFGLRGQAPTCTVTATREAVTSFYGLTASGYRYAYDAVSGRIDVWRDGEEEYGDLRSRRFVPALADWARALGLELSQSIIDTLAAAALEAAAMELPESSSGA